MDLATLGIEVKSDSVPAATKDLKGLQDQAGKTESATDKLGKAATEAGGALNALSNGGGLAAKSLGNLIGLAAGAVAALGGFVLGLLTLDRIVDATSEAESAMAQLNARLKATEEVSGRTAEGLEATAKQLQNITTYSDDTIVAMEAVLLQFRNVRGDTFDRATKSALDLAAAMGTDTKSAAEKLGQALNFPISGMTVLGRAGVKFTEDQKKAVEQLTRTGDVAGAQKIILDNLAKSFGGAAEAARNTLGGALDALKNAFDGLFVISGKGPDNLREAIERLITAIKDPAFVTAIQAIGTALFNALALAVELVPPVVNAIGTITKALIDVAPYATEAAIALALIYAPSVIAGVTVLSELILTLTANLAGLAIGFALANPVVLFVAGFALAVAAAIHFRDDITNFIGVDIVGVVKDSVNQIIGSFVAAYHDIAFIWQNFPDIIEAAVIGAVNAVGDGIGKMIDKSKAGINSLLDTLNHIPGLDLSQYKLDTSNFSSNSTIPNPAADRLAAASNDNEARTKADMSKDYLGDAASAIKDLTKPTTEAGDAMGQTAGAAFKMGDAVDSAAKKGSTALRDLLKNAQDTVDKMNLQAQTAGLSGIAADTLAFKLKLLADATDKGRTITPEFRAEVEKLTVAFEAAATAAADAKLKADNLFALQQLGRSDTEASVASALKAAGLPVDLDSFNAGLLRTTEYVKTARGLTLDFFGSLSSDLKEGVSLVDSLKNAFMKLADQLIQMALNSAIQSLFGSLLGGGTGSSSGGGIGDILGFAINGFTGFAAGGFTGGTENQPAGVVHGQEFVNNAASTRKNGRLLQALNDNPDLMNTAASAGNSNQPTSYSPTFMIDARGAQQGVGKEIADALAAYDKGRVGRLATDLPILRKRTGQG